MAINLYLAEKYGRSSLWPDSVQEHGHTYQWSFWALTELEPHLVTLFLNAVFTPPEQRDEQSARAAADALGAPIRVLGDHLNDRDYLLGSRFTIADLNLASVLSMTTLVGLDLVDTPTAQSWLQRCVSREANQRVQALRQ